MNDPAPPNHGHSASEFSPTADEPACQQLVELVTDYVEGILQPRTLRQVEGHLLVCEFCATYVEQMQTAIACLHELREKRSPEPPDSVLAALRARRGARA